jgi:hypothetical protein
VYLTRSKHILWKGSVRTSLGTLAFMAEAFAVFLSPSRLVRYDTSFPATSFTIHRLSVDLTIRRYIISVLKASLNIPRKKVQLLKVYG